MIKWNEIIKQRVFERDSFKCVICGLVKDVNNLRIHYLKSTISNDIDNMLTVCIDHTSHLTRTKIRYEASDDTNLITTVPGFIKRYLGLQENDMLEWLIDRSINRDLVIIVRKELEK